MSVKETIKMSIDLVSSMEEDEDKEFSTARIQFLSDGKNAYDIPITEEMLRRDAKTVLGKWVVASFNKWTKDVKSHDEDQAIVGIVPKDAQITFKKTSNGTFAVVDAVISKLYSNGVYEMFKESNGRSVSVEMLLDWDGEGEDKKLLGFNIVGITILGKNVSPACRLAGMEIIQFSEEKANAYYNGQTTQTLEQFAEKRKKDMSQVTLKVNKTELKDTPWGSVDKTKLRNKIMNAKNRDSVVHDVYLLVEEGWQDAPSQHLKYPVMQLIGDTLYYNRHALSSAKGYAEKEGETSVINKVNKLYKKFKIGQKEGEKSVNGAKFAIDLDTLWGVIYGKLEERYPDNDYGSIYRIKGIYEENNQKFAIVRRKDENCLYRLDITINESEEIELSEELKEVKEGFNETGEVTKFSVPEDALKYTKFEDDEENEDNEGENEDNGENHDDEGNEDGENHDDEDGKGKMSSDANVDGATQQKIAEDQAENNKKQLEEKENVIMQLEAKCADYEAKMAEMQAKCDELQKFKDDIQEKQKTFAIEQCLAEVKTFVSKSQFEDLQEEGKNCKFEDIEAFETKTKAIAFSAMSKKPVKRDTLWMPISEDSKPVKKGLWG